MSSDPDDRVHWKSVLAGAQRAPAVSVLLALACGPAGDAGDANGGDRTGVDAEPGRDSAGVRITEDPGVDRPLPWTFSKSLDLGSAGGGPEAFHRLPPQPVAVDSSGTLYVLDRGNHRVVAFGPDGRHLRTFGREGRGPGEFFNPVAIWLGRDGDLRVMDWGRSVVMRFAPDGEHLGERRVPVAGLGIGPRMRPVGSKVAFASEEALRDTTADSTVTRVLVAGRADTTILARLATGPPKPVVLGPCEIDVRMHPVYQPEIAWAAGGNEVVVNAELGYVVDRYREGARVASVRRSIRPARVTREDALAKLGEDIFVACPIDAAEMLEKRGFREVQQVVDALRVAPDGHLWVRRTSATDSLGPIDVFDPAGAYLGTLPPEGPFPLAFTPSGGLVTREVDELEVEHVVVYAVDRTAQPRESASGDGA